MGNLRRGRYTPGFQRLKTVSRPFTIDLDIQLEPVSDLGEYLTEGRWTLTIEGPLYSAEGEGLPERKFKLMATIKALVNIPRPESARARRYHQNIQRCRSHNTACGLHHRTLPASQQIRISRLSNNAGGRNAAMEAFGVPERKTRHAGDLGGAIYGEITCPWPNSRIALCSTTLSIVGRTDKWELSTPTS